MVRLLKSIQRWRSARRNRTDEPEGEHTEAHQAQQLPSPSPAAAAAAAAARATPDLASSSSGSDQGSSRTSSPTGVLREPPRAAVITALAGYDVCDSAGSSDISRITPLRIQALDEAEGDAQQKPFSTKSRFTPAPRKPGTAGGADAEVLPPPSRRGLVARCAAAAAATAAAAAVAAAAAARAAAASGQHYVLVTRDKAAAWRNKVTPTQLPTSTTPQTPDGPPPAKLPWRQRAQEVWREHPRTSAVAVMLLLAVLGLLLGVAVGVGARDRGRFPRWARGEGDDFMWVPTGDPQLDSLLRLKAAVDSNNLLTGWTAAAGSNGAYCSWDFVTCDAAGKTVEALNLTTNTFTFVLKGRLPSGEALSGLSGLKSIDIREHHISGLLPEDWYLLPLEAVRLDQNMLTGELPDAWFGEGPLSSSLRVLTLWDNKLSGSLPDTQGGMKALQQLDLSFNGLSGSLPSSWSSMTSLQQLWLDVNKLTGPLPSSWSSMTSLQKLMLSENGLSGALPPSWSNMKALQELWLEYNNISGQLPDAYSALSELTTLVLNNNDLSLTVPAAWSELRQLKTIYLYNNKGLKGCLPRSWRTQLSRDFDVGYFLKEGTGIKGFCSTS